MPGQIDEPIIVNFREIQAQHREWSRRNFGPESHAPKVPGLRTILGVMEEVGELAHAHLKQEQGIRGTPQEHEAAAQDAIGDAVIYLIDYCSCRGWDFAAIVDATWAQVRQRDWQANKQNGETK